MRRKVLVLPLIAGASLFLLASCGESQARQAAIQTATPTETSVPSRYVNPEDVVLKVVPVEEPVKFNAGRGTLTAASPDTKPGVEAQSLLDQYVGLLGPEAKGLTVEARFGMYTDTSYGSDASNKFTPLLTDHPAWVLRFRGSSPHPAGPADAEVSIPPAGSYDTTVIFDGESGTMIFGFEEASSAAAG